MKNARDFWVNVDKSGDCWLWRGTACKKTGYGHFSFHAHTEVAHRVAWELTNGPIPNGLVIIRNCDNRLCCNPEHMRVVTYSEQRKLCKTTPRGENHWERKHPDQIYRLGNTRVTAKQVIEMRARYTAGERKNVLMRDYRLSYAHVCNILTGRAWKHPVISEPATPNEKLAQSDELAEYERLYLAKYGVPSTSTCQDSNPVL